MYSQHERRSIDLMQPENAMVPEPLHERGVIAGCG